MKPLYTKCITGLLSVLLLTAGCKKIDDLQKNPNASGQGSPKLILTGILLDTYQGPWSFAHRMNQFNVLNFNYYGDQSYTWGSGDTYFGTLRNLERLDLEVGKLGDNPVNAGYKAIGKFVRALLYSRMTEQMGDLPLKDAMKAKDGLYYPAYDAQKDIYLQCFKWLDDANNDMKTLLAANPLLTVDGDPYYGGKIAKWQKAVNSLRLRLLISLSKKEADADLGIKQQFATIIGDPVKYPLITDNVDNLQIKYNASQKDNNYPIYPDESSYYVNRDILGATWVDLLTARKDPRIFIIASPAPNIPNDPLNPFARYKGAKTGDQQNTIQAQTNAGLHCYLKRDYWLANAVGIPCIQLGASETNFNIAEGINRGWAAGDAGSPYIKGITASMQFYGVAATDINIYTAQAMITYAGNSAAGLAQILTQKYMAFFENSGYQAYFNYRRTGIPTFDIGPANDNGGRIPTRFTYPNSEYQNNTANVKAAVQKQFNGSDTRNDVLWMMQ